jgi:hypothetical protein
MGDAWIKGRVRARKEFLDYLDRSKVHSILKGEIVMSKSLHSNALVVILTFLLALLVGWKGAKDRALSSSEKGPSKLCASIAPIALSFLSPTIRDSKPAPPGSPSKVNKTYGKLPLSFEANQGQVDSQVKFLSRGQGCSLFLTATEAVLQLPSSDGRWPNDDTSFDHQQSTTEILSLPFSIPYSQSTLRPSPLDPRHLSISHRKWAIGHPPSSSLRMQLVGANPQVQVEGLEALPGKSNYFIGNDPGKWRTNISTYSKVKYKEVYPGIDLVYYGNQQKLEYDWVVAPGGDPNAIQVVFQGQEDLLIDSAGDLVLKMGKTEVRQKRPVVFQEVAGEPKEIAGGYILGKDGRVGFEAAAYDHSRSLVIDPTVIYSSLFAAGSSFLGGTGIAIDQLGNVYLTGTADSVDFPSTPGAFDRTYGGLADAFVAKLDSSGSSVIYCTYLGGKGNDVAGDITLDSDGNAYLTGFTDSSDFPILGAAQASLRGGSDGYIAKLNPIGSVLIYSTFLGGSKEDWPRHVAIDAAGNTYVTGFTTSEDFPTLSAFQPKYGGGDGDGFVTKLNAAGSTLLYSTYLGGSGEDAFLGAVAVDAQGSAYVTGGTSSSDFPMKNPFQSQKGPYSTAFISKLSPSGSSLEYSTFLGLSSYGMDILVTAEGESCVTGSAYPDDFPVTEPSLTLGGLSAFLCKLDASASHLVFSRLVGGSGQDEVRGMTRDTAGNFYIVGRTLSQDFPTSNAIQPNLAGDYDAFLIKFTSTGAGPVYATYWGGTDRDTATAVAADNSGNIYMAGTTSSSNFPLLHSLHTSRQGAEDYSFIVKLSEEGSTSLSAKYFVPIVLSSPGMNDSFFKSEMTLTNKGASDVALEYEYTASFGGGSGSAADKLSPGQQKVIPDAIEYLKSMGVPLPDSGARGGTLHVKVSGMTSLTDAAVTLRTTTAVANGRAGLAYSALPGWSLLGNKAFLCGLRQNAKDRSNLAVQNAGSTGDGYILLELTIYSGERVDPPATPFSVTLPTVRLEPGEFKQISGILQFNDLSLTSGYVKVARVGGTAPFFAYAVINDQVTSDGSFVPPMSFGSNPMGMTLPVVVETSLFNSELILAECEGWERDLSIEFVADAVQAPDSTARFQFNLKPYQQIVIPNLIQYLRDQSVSGIGPIGPTYAGALYVKGNGVTRGVFMGARTSAPGGGGQYGLFYTAIPFGQASTTDAWLYGLQQNTENRTNLALVNTGEAGSTPDVFNIELYDGATGQLAATVSNVSLAARSWKQINRILALYASQVTQGYAHVVRSSGNNPFIAYAVINDGGQAGQRTGDGAFVSSAP